MARIAKDEIERLKNEVAVLRLAEAAGLELKKSGKDWIARCPFHADETASMVVTPLKNLWHCLVYAKKVVRASFRWKIRSVVPFALHSRARGCFLWL